MINLLKKNFHCREAQSTDCTEFEAITEERCIAKYSTALL